MGTSCGTNLSKSTVRTDDDHTVDVWEEPLLGSERSWDLSLVSSDGSRVILAVADAAVNTNDPDHREKSDFALKTTMSAVLERGLPEGLDHAANRIHKPAEMLRQRNGMVTFAGVEIRDDMVNMYRCADSEVWVRHGTVWTEVFPGDMLSPDARVLCDLAMPRSPRGSWWTVQELLLNDLNDWVSPAIGQDSEAHPQHEQIPLSGVDEIVVSTDGATLDQNRLMDLDRWLEHGVHVMPDNHPHPAPHGDLTVLRWRLG